MCQTQVPIPMLIPHCKLSGLRKSDIFPRLKWQVGNRESTRQLARALYLCAGALGNDITIQLEWDKFKNEKKTMTYDPSCEILRYQCHQYQYDYNFCFTRFHES